MGEPANKGEKVAGRGVDGGRGERAHPGLRERPERGQERRYDRRDVRRRATGQRDARPTTIRPRPRAGDGPCPSRQGRQGAHRRDRPDRPGVRRTMVGQEECSRAERAAAVVLHDYPERPVRGRPRLLIRPPSLTAAGRPSGHRASCPPACAAPLARDGVGARGEDVAGDQRPARALVDRGHRPLPTADRPDRARRRGTRPRTPRVNGARETPPPALGGKRSGGSRARRGGGRAYPHRLIPIPRRGVLCDGWGASSSPTPGPPSENVGARVPPHGTGPVGRTYPPGGFARAPFGWNRALGSVRGAQHGPIRWRCS